MKSIELMTINRYTFNREDIIKLVLKQFPNMLIYLSSSSLKRSWINKTSKFISLSIYNQQKKKPFWQFNVIHSVEWDIIEMPINQNKHDYNGLLEWLSAVDKRKTEVVQNGKTLDGMILLFWVVLEPEYHLSS